MILWCIEILRHYVVHPELTQCCRSIMLLLLFSHSVVSNSSRPHGSTPGFPVLDHLPEVAQIQPSLVLCHPLLLPSIFPSIRVFSNESVLHIRCPKYWNFTFNISPSHEHSGLISFRMDWLYLLAVQGTLKSLLQHHSSKASILQCSAFFIVQLSHPYLTTGKTIVLTIDGALLAK